MHFDWHQPSDRTTYKQHSEQPRHFIEEQKTRQQLVKSTDKPALDPQVLNSPMSDAVRKHDEWMNILHLNTIRDKAVKCLRGRVH